MYRYVFTVGVAVTEVMYRADGTWNSGALTSANALTDYSYINARDSPGNNGAQLARCVTGLGPNGTGRGANDILGGLYFNGNKIPVLAPPSSCSDNSEMIQARLGGSLAGVFNFRQCGSLTTAAEGVYTCALMNSAMMNQSVRFGIYLNGRSESLAIDLYISSLNHLSSLYTAAPAIDPISPNTMTVNVGDPLTLSCTSQGSPPDTFTWRKDNGPVLQSTTTPVTYNNNRAVFRADYSIASVTTSDSGTYTCNVTNPIGSDGAVITVNVISKLSSTSDLQPNIPTMNQLPGQLVSKEIITMHKN